MRGLNEYLKTLVTMYEAISHPSLQKFLAIDTNLSPNYEYQPILPHNQVAKLPRQFAQLINRNRVINSGDELLLNRNLYLFSSPSTEEIKASELLLNTYSKLILSRDKANNQKDKDDVVKDVYEEIPAEKCTATQRLVQRVAKMSSFYVRENVELFDLSQKLAIMKNDCSGIDKRVKVLNKKFKFTFV
eukprot:TRINITY_DN4035_c0_g2_i1.p1 TRINITY_DN4035_c0_g2~~TRINITY_DN4035_c0_g2_i1.p1  ORF type:complete len:188 (-),score=66.04 TRINITY_DN4035_c0_g2_i1:130-693(-)